MAIATVVLLAVLFGSELPDALFWTALVAGISLVVAAVVHHRWNRRSALGAGALTALVLVTALALSSITGLPGPGPVRRYPTSDLDRLARGLNDAEALRFETSDPMCGEKISISADVDVLRSRVSILAEPGDEVRFERALGTLLEDLGASREMVTVDYGDFNDLDCMVVG